MTKLQLNYFLSAVRTQIARLLRSLLISGVSATDVEAKVLDLSETYGDLDGENNWAYAKVFAHVYQTLTSEQTTKLAVLRKSIMSGAYADGTPFDYSVCATFFLYSSPITDVSVLNGYISNTDYLFGLATLAAPTSVAASDGAYPDKVQVTWTTSTGATSYEVWRNTVNNNATASLLGSPTASPFEDNKTAPRKTYYYWLRARNSAGTSAFSNPDTGRR